jgi:hypothetical protein
MKGCFSQNICSIEQLGENKNKTWGTVSHRYIFFRSEPEKGQKIKYLMGSLRNYNRLDSQILKKKLLFL